MPQYVAASNGLGYWRVATLDSLYPDCVEWGSSEDPSLVPWERSREPVGVRKKDAQEVVLSTAITGKDDHPPMAQLFGRGPTNVVRPNIGDIPSTDGGSAAPFNCLLDKLAEQVDGLQETVRRLREQPPTEDPQAKKRIAAGCRSRDELVQQKIFSVDPVQQPKITESVSVGSGDELRQQKIFSVDSVQQPKITESGSLGSGSGQRALAKKKTLSFSHSSQLGGGSCDPLSLREHLRKGSGCTSRSAVTSSKSIGEGSDDKARSVSDLHVGWARQTSDAARSGYDGQFSKPLAPLPQPDAESVSAGSDRDDPMDVNMDEDQCSMMFVELHDQWDHVHHRLKGQMTLGFDIFQKSSYVHDRGFYLGHKSFLQRLVVEPSSDFCLYWALVEMFLLLYDVVTIPTMVFNPPETWFNTLITWSGVIFRTLDVPVSSMHGYVTRRGDLEMKLKKVVLHYLRSHFLLDFVLLAIEWVSFAVATFQVGGDLTEFGRFVQLVRFCRLLKVAKFRRISSSCLKRIRSNMVLVVLSMARGLFIVLFIMHYAACGFYAIGDWDIYESRWIDDEFRDRSYFFRYTSCVMWSFTHMGLGTLDIEPSNVLEGAYANVVTLVGMVSFSLMVGNIVVGLTRLQTLNQSCREQEDFLRDFMAKYKVSWPLRNRIWSFLKKSSDGGKIVMAEKRVELIRNLPRSMALELRAEVYIPVLTVHPFFNMYSVSQADKSAMYSLMEAQAVIAKTLQAEHELFVERQPALAMHFVVSGVMTYTQVISSETLIFDFTSSREVVSPKSLPPDTMNKRISFLAEGFSMAEVRHGTWLCEHALWLNWRYMGMAVAETRCELVGVDADKFRNIMASNLPEAQRYAKEYVRLVEARKDVMNDVWMDLGAIKRVAQDIFEPPLAFEIKKCRPVTNTAQSLSEWKPADRRAWQRLWTSPWQDCHLYNRSALISTMTTEMKYDVILMFHTLFAQNLEAAADIPWTSIEEKFLHDQRVLFMKRLILCLAVCGVSFSTEENGQHTQPWRYPLASIFCHGGRTLLRLVDVQWKEFVNFLFYGDEHGWQWDESGPPPPLYTRRAATHGVRLDCRTSSLEEVRLRGTSTIGRGHFGMDLPVGGVGNPAPAHKSGQLCVGPSGVPFKKTRRQKNAHCYVKEYQHGHFYMRHDEFGDRYLPLLSPLASTSGVEAKDVGRKNRRSLTVMSRRPTRILTSTSVVSNAPTFKRGYTSDRLVSGLWGSEGESVWTPLRGIPTPQALESYLQRMHSFTSADLDSQSRTANLLYHYAEEQKELRVETNDSQIVRCKGMLIFLLVQLEEDDGSRKVLVHKGASVSTGETPETVCEEGLHLDLGVGGFKDHYKEDVRVVTIRSRHNEPWMAAVASYCQRVFRLTDEAIEKLLGGCQEGVDSSYWFTCRAPPTMCKNHVSTCSHLVPLEYDALRVKAVISEKDKQFFGPILGKEFKTYEPAEIIPELNTGAAEQSRPVSETTSEITASISLPVSSGLRRSTSRGPLVQMQKVMREWHWVDRDTSDVRGTLGLDRPTNAKPLRLCKYKQSVGSILFGIESSAPLKEDLFGNSHNPDGQSKEISAFGKRKWKDYRLGKEMAPADLGGLRACLTAGRFRQLQELCADLTLCRPSDGYLPEDHNQDVERALFMSLLEASSSEAHEVLFARYGLRHNSVEHAEVFATDLFGDLLNDDAAD